MILWLLLVVLVLWTCLFRFRRRRIYSLASTIPGPDSELPVIGIAHKLAGNGEDIMYNLQNFTYESIQNDGLIKVWLNHLLYYLVTNPMDVEVVLKTCLEKDDLHIFMRKVIGNGGIFAPVSIWRRRRKIIVPVFSPKNVEQFIPIFSENGQKLVNKLGSHQGTGKFSIWPYISSYSLDAIGETALGVKINSQEDKKSSFLTSLNVILDLVCNRIFHLWLQPDWLFKIFPQYKLHQKSIKVLHNFTDEIIIKKRADISLYKNRQSEAENHSNEDEYQNKTFLDLLISLSGGEKGYNNVELREEVLTLTIAGTDTSAVATGYTLMLLAKYPKIQDKVYEELYEIFGDSNRSVTKQDLLDMKYLERVVKESVRLFPPVPFIIRKVETEVKLPSSRVLPAGSGAVICIWGCHRDPKYWGSDAEHFDPDRFLPERFNLKHACSFMPFSNGPRNCVAMSEKYERGVIPFGKSWRGFLEKIVRTEMHKINLYINKNCSFNIIRK